MCGIRSHDVRRFFFFFFFFRARYEKYISTISGVSTSMKIATHTLLSRKLSLASLRVSTTRGRIISLNPFLLITPWKNHTAIVFYPLFKSGYNDCDSTMRIRSRCRFYFYFGSLPPVRFSFSALSLLFLRWHSSRRRYSRLVIDTRLFSSDSTFCRSQICLGSFLQRVVCLFVSPSCHSPLFPRNSWLVDSGEKRRDDAESWKWDEVLRKYGNLGNLAKWWKMVIVVKTSDYPEIPALVILLLLLLLLFLLFLGLYANSATGR